MAENDVEVPVRGFHAMAYLGPWARLGRGWDGFENSWRSGVPRRGWALDPWAQKVTKSSKK